MSATNLEHIVALTFIGFGGLFLMATGHSEAGAVLLGALGGYAFKNGVLKSNHASEVPKQGQ